MTTVGILFFLAAWIAGTKFESDWGESNRAVGFWDRIV